MLRGVDFFGFAKNRKKIDLHVLILESTHEDINGHSPLTTVPSTPVCAVA